MNTSGKEFVDFWGWASSKGLMNENTARALAAAAKQVISIDDEWETKDVSDINIDEFIGRFNNLRRTFKPESLQAYARRFKQAYSLFMAYQKDPANWKPSGVISPAKKGRGLKQEAQRESINNGDNDFTQAESSPAKTFMDYPYPLREGCIVRLRLPIDLKINEAERLGAFMRTLATDFKHSPEN